MGRAVCSELPGCQRASAAAQYFPDGRLQACSLQPPTTVNTTRNRNRSNPVSSSTTNTASLSMASSIPYVYTPLPTLNHTRIVELLPAAQQAAPLICRLVPLDLDSVDSPRGYEHCPTPGANRSFPSNFSSRALMTRAKSRCYPSRPAWPRRCAVCAAVGM